MLFKEANRYKMLSCLLMIVFVVLSVIHTISAEEEKFGLGW